MFQRVLLESWHDYVPYVCFALIGGSFLAILVRAAFMRPDEAGRLAALPLLGDEELEQQRESTSDETIAR